MTKPLTLISFNLCPFVQRAAIALHEQGREYDIRYIDLQNRPDWFKAISPLGKVPVLKVGEAAVFESNVILNYLDETCSEDIQLFASDPLARAQQRMWIEYISGIMSKGWSLQAASDETTARDLCTEIRGRFERLLENYEGPLWAGEQITMVDVSIAPILQRFAWADTLEPSLGIFDGMPRLQAWRDALLKRPSLKDSILPDLETINAHGLHSIGSWIARNAA